MDHHWKWRAKVAERELRLLKDAWEDSGDDDGTYSVYGGDDNVFTAKVGFLYPAWSNGKILALGNPPQFTCSNKYIRLSQDTIQGRVDRMIEKVIRLNAKPARKHSSDTVETVLLVGEPNAAEAVVAVPEHDYEWFADSLEGDAELEFRVAGNEDPVQVWYGSLRIGLIMPICRVKPEHDAWLQRLGITLKGE